MMCKALGDRQRWERPTSPRRLKLPTPPHRLKLRGLRRTSQEATSGRPLTNISMSVSGDGPW